MYFSLLLGMVLFMTPKHSRMLEVVLIKTKGLQCLFHPNIHSFMVQTTKYSFQGALQIPSHPHPSGCVISILISFFFFSLSLLVDFEIKNSLFGLIMRTLMELLWHQMDLKHGCQKLVCKRV